MAQAKIVTFKKKALDAMAASAYFIESEGYPETAFHFYNRMIDFGESLAGMPFKYPVCKSAPLAKKKFRCVTYKGYVFIYKVQANLTLVIADFIHGSLLK